MEEKQFKNLFIYLFIVCLFVLLSLQLHKDVITSLWGINKWKINLWYKYLQKKLFMDSTFNRIIYLELPDIINVQVLIFCSFSSSKMTGDSKFLYRFWTKCLHFLCLCFNTQLCRQSVLCLAPWKSNDKSNCNKKGDISSSMIWRGGAAWETKIQKVTETPDGKVDTWVTFTTEVHAAS